LKTSKFALNFKLLFAYPNQFSFISFKTSLFIASQANIQSICLASLEMSKLKGTQPEFSYIYAPSFLLCRNTI